MLPNHIIFTQVSLIRPLARVFITYLSLGFALVAYPNRDSTPYRERYNIPEAETIIRGVRWFFFDSRPFKLMPRS